MSTAEEDDFSAIIKILESAQSGHRLKWILRNVADNPGKTEAEKGKALQEGIKKVLCFGEDVADLEQAQKIFARKVETLLKSNGIQYE